MAKVGDLKAYHDGTSYSVAELYDEEVSTIQKSSIENARGAVHFDTDIGVVLEVKTKNSSTLAPKFYKNGSAVADVTPYVTADHAKFDYALKFNASEKNYLASTNFSAQGGKGYTMEGWFYVDTTADSDTGTLFSYSTNSGSNPQAIRKVSYSYTKENGVVKPKLNNVEVDEGTFDAPFHIAHIWRGNAVGHVNYCNGKHFQTQAASGSGYWASTGSTVSGAYIGVDQKSTRSNVGNYYTVSITTPYFTGYCSEFKVTNAAVYGAISTSPYYVTTFTPPTKSVVWGKIPVEGNVGLKTASGIVYAPLSSDVTYKSPPCLNVRHNGANYFTVK